MSSEPHARQLMGSMFDLAFRRFATAFEQRADKIYGMIGGHFDSSPVRSRASEAVFDVLIID